MQQVTETFRNVFFGAKAGAEEALPAGACAPARNGQRTVKVTREDGREAWLHSRHDPLGEARAQTAESAIGDLDTVFLLGLGLGYPALALAERLGAGNNLIVIERSRALFQEALATPGFIDVLRRPRTLCFVGADSDEIYDYLIAKSSLFLAAGMKFVPHAPSRAAFPTYYGQCVQRVEDFVRTGGVLIKTTMYLSRIAFRNRMRNLWRYVDSPGVLPYKDRFAGTPGVIVSAGPSLAKNMALLARVKGRAPIVAVSTSLRAMLGKGLAPDFSVVIDYGRLSCRYFENIHGAERIPLICDTKANADAVAAYDGPRMFFDDLLINTMLGGIGAPKGELAGGSTVAHVAYHFLCYMGCDPVIFIGQDLAYTDGELHVPGTAVYQQSLGEFNRFYTPAMKEFEYYLTMRPRLREVPAWGGGTVKTCDVFGTYLEEFEGFFRKEKRRIIDATEGGALKRGAERMRFADAIDACMDAELPAGLFDIPAVPAAECAARREHAHARLAALARECAELGTCYDDVIPLVKKVLKENRKGRAADRTVEKILAIKERFKGYGVLYLVLTHLAQSDLFLRMRRDRELDDGAAEGVKRQERQAERDLEYLTGLAGALEFFRTELAAAGESTEGAAQ